MCVIWRSSGEETFHSVVASVNHLMRSIVKLKRVSVSGNSRTSNVSLKLLINAGVIARNGRPRAHQLFAGIPSPLKDTIGQLD
jgi:hypothetical protein